jgi:hypothetical protein
MIKEIRENVKLDGIIIVTDTLQKAYFKRNPAKDWNCIIKLVGDYVEKPG